MVAARWLKACTHTHTHTYSMTTGLVGGVGDVSGDFSHGVYWTKNMN